MTTFDDRERAFETLFAQGQDSAFRTRARRDRALGLWAAHALGRSGDDAELYASGIVAIGVEGGEDAVAAKLGEDLNGHGLVSSEPEIRRRMADLLAASIADAKEG